MAYGAISEEGCLHLKNATRLPSVPGIVFLVVATLLVNAFVSYRGLRNLVGHDQLVIHTLQVIGELDATLTTIKDSENERGFLITRDRDYLASHRLAIADVPRHLQRLAALTSDNPYQQSRIPMLEELIRQRVEDSARTLDAEQAGNHREATQMVASQLSRRRMDQIRELISEMKRHEERLFDVRTQDARRSVRQAAFAFSVTWLLAMVFIVAFFVQAKRDALERARDADTIREKESWLRTTMHSIGDAVIATDAAGKVTFLNRTAEGVIGCSSSACEGKPLPDIFPIYNEMTGAPAANPIWSVIRQRTVIGLENHTVLRNLRGEKIPIEDSAAPILDAKGNLSGAVLVFRDVTQQRKIQEVARTSEKLAATGRLAATIAHEINNPLEAAINLLYLAQHTTAPGKIREYVACADHELSHVAHITRKTLAFHRSPSAAMPTNVRDMLEEVVDVYRGRIENQRIKVEIICPGDLVITTVKGDLVQIASNLIVNALDALESNGNLRIGAAPEREGAARLEFQDNGSGISPENLNRVFEPFFTTKKDTGTGLGLWVVKDLVEKFGGTISVTSRVGGPRQGTRFSLVVPSHTRQSIKSFCDADCA